MPLSVVGCAGAAAAARTHLAPVPRHQPRARAAAPPAASPAHAAPAAAAEALAVDGGGDVRPVAPPPLAPEADAAGVAGPAALPDDAGAAPAAGAAARPARDASPAASDAAAGAEAGAADPLPVRRHDAVRHVPPLSLAVTEAQAHALLAQPQPDRWVPRRARAAFAEVLCRALHEVGAAVSAEEQVAAMCTLAAVPRLVMHSWRDALENSLTVLRGGDEAAALLQRVLQREAPPPPSGGGDPVRIAAELVKHGRAVPALHSRCT